MPLSYGYSPYRSTRRRRKHARNPELLIVTSGNPPKYQVYNKRTGGTSYFDSKTEALRAAERMRGLNPSVLPPEVWSDVKEEPVYGPSVWLRDSGQAAVSSETPSQGRRSKMRRRKSKGKKFIRMGGKKVSWRGLVKKFGVRGAKKKWRKAKKIGGSTKRRGRKGRRKGGRRSGWKSLVKKYGVKRASCMYKRKSGSKRRRKSRR